MKFSFCTFALVALVLCASASAQEVNASATQLDPLLPYRADRANAVTYDVDFSIVVTAPYKTKKLRVWLPIPQTDVAQEVRDSRLTSFPMAVEPKVATEGTFGNKFAYFEFDSPQGAQIIRHQFQVQVWELHWKLDPKKILAIRDWPKSFDRYRTGDLQSVVVDERFGKLLDEIVPIKNNVANDFGDVMRWVQRNFQYDHVDASLRASSEHALTKRRGHCSDYHGFCASMGRALGLPTRITYGINPFPKNSPSHCKLEAFLAPYGWVSFDVSETQKLIATIRKEELPEAQKAKLIELAQTRLASGFRDNTWYLQTRGSDYDLVPPASKRVPVVRTAYIEADGVALPEPDPADPNQKAYSWMTVHQYRADRNVTYPFADWKTLHTFEK